MNLSIVSSIAYKLALHNKCESTDSATYDKLFASL